MGTETHFLILACYQFIIRNKETPCGDGNSKISMILSYENGYIRNKETPCGDGNSVVYSGNVKPFGLLGIKRPLVGTEILCLE